MSTRERDDYRPGVPWWVTTLQPDPPAAAAFYDELFGWENEDHPAGFFLSRLNGREVAAVAPQPQGVTEASWVTQVLVSDADAIAEKATAAGGSVLASGLIEPAGRITVVADPAGGILAALDPSAVAEPAHHGARVVNEPGAWAMSGLQTPDTEAAAAFYGAVFGWTTETFEMGDASATMFRLPGYVGGEPEQPVSRETIAVMMPAPDGAPARWGVDFWVRDVDETAAKAGALGGSALAGPFDTPMGRTAVLADPAGAAFSVTRLAAVSF